jgi:hypothetical protein
LDDLLHDLGKYIAFPLQMLPVDASTSEFREALYQAIHVTRTGPSGSQSASEIWQDFLQEGGNVLRGQPGWNVLLNTVEGALAWGERLRESAQPIDRAKANDDLRAVSSAIRDFRDNFCD